MKPTADEAIALLRRLIGVYSPSRREEGTAALLYDWLKAHGAKPCRYLNNVWAVAGVYDSSRPTLLLNSHHDTVKPSPSYTRDPQDAAVEGDRLYGLGSNDAGASVVSLAAAFINVIDEKRPFNLILALTAAEENMAPEGMRSFLPEMKRLGITIDMALVGEPTGMCPAIAERGLLVLDGIARGVAGHAARNEGVNAIYKAMEAIDRLRSFSPPKVSDVLGPIKVSVTQIEAGTQHNVVPAECRFVTDVRTTDAYSNEETARMLVETAGCELIPRSTRVHASVIPVDHPLVRAAMTLGREPFVSPTTSDMALMHDIPSLKMGPGQSERSHSADEFVLLSEIRDAIPEYIEIINKIKDYI